MTIQSDSHFYREAESLGLDLMILSAGVRHIIALQQKSHPALGERMTEDA
jgi:hypothetical protein